MILAATLALTQSPFAILVFSKTAGFRHDSIPTGIEMIRSLGKENNFTITTSEDSSVFTKDNLKNYQVVVFLNTTGDILNQEQQTSFRYYVETGGGFVGVHAAADTEYDWQWYGSCVGAHFKSHPAIQKATVIVTDKKHPSTQHLSTEWSRTDEWYDYKSIPNESRILAKLDTATYQGHTMGENHPIVWCHSVEKGRAWYTGMGHTKETYSEPDFRKHLLGGILWAAQIAN